MVTMPIFFIPTVKGCKDPLTMAAVSSYRGLLVPLVIYPNYTGDLGTKIAPEDVSVLEACRVVNLNNLARTCSRLRPRWTILHHLWYNGIGDVEEVARVIGPHAGTLIVPCGRPEVVRYVPRYHWIGLDVKSFSAAAGRGQVETEHLVGRKVCLVGGGPVIQWMTFCTLVAQGVEVVGVRLNSEWYIRAHNGNRFIGPHLRHIPSGLRSWQQAALEGVRNLIGYWWEGIQRINGAG